MIIGSHVIVFSRDPEADRAFVADVLGLRHVDAGGGWLIFKLPPAELAVHPSDGPTGHELYLMCDDLHAEVHRIRRLGTMVSDIRHAPWGSVTQVRLPGGGQIGLYQPRHPTAIPAPGAG